MDNTRVFPDEPTDCIGPGPNDPVRFALKTYPCVVCGKGEVWKPEHECNKCRSRKPAFAVIDGVGDTAEVHLYATREDVQHDRECKWPFDWPKRVSWEFLEAHGCKVRTT